MNTIETYRNGEITQDSNGTYGATYLNRRGGESYQALAGQGWQFPTIEAARAAIDTAIAVQDAYLSQFDALTYHAARAAGVGTRWPRPTFGGQTEVLTVAHVGSNYIVSTDSNGLAYLSMGEADCEYACQKSDVIAWVLAFEAKYPLLGDSCHYCGLPVASAGFFGEPTCRECGGR